MAKFKMGPSSSKAAPKEEIIKVVEKEVIREVKVPVEVIKEVKVEVPKIIEKTKVVEKKVPVEVIKEIIKEVKVEVPVEKIVEKEVEKQVVTEVVRMKITRHLPRWAKVLLILQTLIIIALLAGQ